MNGNSLPTCWGDHRFTDQGISTKQLVRLAQLCADCPTIEPCRAGIPADRAHFVIRAGIVGRQYRRTAPSYVIVNLRDIDLNNG